MTVKVLQGDARRVLETLPEKSVHVVVTSPPY
jgi:DNA modification methylase